MSSKPIVVAVLALFSLLASGCSTPVSQDRLPVPSGSVPIVIDPGSDTYEDTSDSIVPLPSASPAESSGSEKPPVDSEDSQLAKDLCERVAAMAIEFSKVASESSGSPYIAKLLDWELVADNRATAVAPAPDEVAVVIECYTTVALSTGDKGTVTLYELLDGNGKTRVRWDSYTPQ